MAPTLVSLGTGAAGGDVRGARRIRRGRVATLVLAAALATPAWAVRPILWTEGASGPRLGDAESVAFTTQNAIVLAPRIEDLAPQPASSAPSVETATSDSVSDPLVWCEAIDPKGNVYLGTGHSGRILRVSSRGEISVVGSLPEPEVTALLVSRAGEIFAASSPNGAVYKLGKDGTPAVFYEPEERYIWALVEDGSGNLFAGTGEKGKIFRITPKGEGSLYYDSTEPHITTLIAERAGSLLAGSDGTGKIYRIGKDQKAVILYDSNYREIADLAEDGSGQIYAAAVAAGAGEIPPPAPRILVRPSDSEAPIARGDDSSPVRPEGQGLGGRDRDREPFEAEWEGGNPPSSQARAVREGGGAIFRISPQGRVEEMWRSSTDVPYALAATSEGAVYAGTGEPARLLRLEEKGRAVVLSVFPQAQLTDLALDPGGKIFAATSNSGGAYRITRDLSEQGTYSAPVRDAFARAAWGRIRWDALVKAGQRVEIQTRSGNSSVPDDTWSPWSGAYTDAEGSEITSPPARFIQWRARLTRSGSAESPVLRSVTLTYLPQNRPPRVRELRLLTFDEAPPPIDGEEPPMPSCTGASLAAATGSAPDSAEKTPVRARTLIWHAEDPDDDRLVFRIMAQREGTETWIPVGSDLLEATCALDQSALGEGRYRLKAIASDAPANFAGEALESEGLAEGVMLDLSPPELRRLEPKGREGALEVQATDALSPIASAEIQRAERTIAAARPADGVLDSKSERLILELPSGARPEGLRLRVKDTAGNVSTLDLR
jgi:hypothetical protein